MSHYRERRDKIKNLQSKSLDHLASSAATKSPPEVDQPGPLEQSQSQRRLREASPRWKEHYAKLSQQWSSGVSLAQQESNVVWEQVQKQKERGGYPWTHLSHNQDEEIWLNPQKLPQDIGSVTMLRKDNTIPKEWFHLPKGADVPTVDDLLRDSSPEPDHDNGAAASPRALSPPICGRQRSKSREKVPQKHQASSTIVLHQGAQTPTSYDASSPTTITPATSIYSFQHPAEQGEKSTSFSYEDAEKQIISTENPQILSVQVPSKIEDKECKASSDTKEDKDKLVNISDQNESDKESDSEKSTSCFPVPRKSRSKSKSKERKLQKEKLKKKTKNKEHDNANESKGNENQIEKILPCQGPELLPKGGSLSHVPPPEVDRNSKPNTPSKSPISSDEADGYEPVENGKKNSLDNNIEGNAPLLTSDISDIKKCPEKARDDSRVSGKRDSSKGSGYETVEFEKDNIPRVSLNDSRNELASKIYEDLEDEISEKITEASRNGILILPEMSDSGTPGGVLDQMDYDQNIDEQKNYVSLDKIKENMDAIPENVTMATNDTQIDCQKTKDIETNYKKIISQDDLEMSQKNGKETVETAYQEGGTKEESNDKVSSEEKGKLYGTKTNQHQDVEKSEGDAMEAERKNKEGPVEKDAALKREKETKNKEKDQQQKDKNRVKQENEEKEKHKIVKEKLEKEQAKKEEQERHKEAKERKEKDEKHKKEQKEFEEREARERKAREKMEREQREREEKEKKKIAKEQKETDEKLKREKKETEKREAKERNAKEKIDKEQDDREEKEKRKQSTERKYTEQKLAKEQYGANDIENKERKARKKIEKEQIEKEEREKRRLSKERKEKEQKTKKDQYEAHELDIREKKTREKLEKEKIETEEREKRRQSKERKENEQKTRKEQYEVEDIDTKERKARDKMEGEQAERDEREKRRQSKERKENEQKIRKEQYEAKDIDTKERKARDKMEKEQAKRDEREKRRQSKERKENEQKTRKEQYEANKIGTKERKARDKMEKEQAEREEGEKRRQSKERNENEQTMRKEQNEIQQIATKERKIKEKIEKEQADRDEKEKERLEDEERETEQKIRKERYEAQELEVKERKERERKGKDKNNTLEKEKKEQAKQKKETLEKVSSEENKLKETKEIEQQVKEKIQQEQNKKLEEELIKDAKRENENKIQPKQKKTDNDEEVDFTEIEEHTTETKSQNYDVQGALSITEKEHTCDEQNVYRQENIDSTALEKSKSKSDEFNECENIKQIQTKEDEEMANISYDMINDRLKSDETTQKEDKIESFRAIEMKRSLNPFEEDESEFANEELLNGNNKVNDEPFEMKSHLLIDDKKLDDNCPLIFTDMKTFKENKDDSALIENDPLLESSVEGYEIRGNENQGGNQIVVNDQSEQIQKDADKHKFSSETKKRRKIEEKESRKKLEKESKENRKKEEEEDKKRKQEAIKEANSKKEEEKELSRLSDEENVEKQNELRERWTEQEKERKLKNKKEKVFSNEIKSKKSSKNVSVTKDSQPHNIDEKQSDTIEKLQIDQQPNFVSTPSEITASTDVPKVTEYISSKDVGDLEDETGCRETDKVITANIALGSNEINTEKEVGPSADEENAKTQNELRERWIEQEKERKQKIKSDKRISNETKCKKPSKHVSFIKDSHPDNIAEKQSDTVENLQVNQQPVFVSGTPNIDTSTDVPVVTEYISTEHKRDLKNENACREADNVMPGETTRGNNKINTKKEVYLDTQRDESAFENKMLEVIKDYSNETTSAEVSIENAKKNPFEIEGDINVDLEVRPSADEESGKRQNELRERWIEQEKERKLKIKRDKRLSNETKCKKPSKNVSVITDNHPDNIAEKQSDTIEKLQVNQQPDFVSSPPDIATSTDVPEVTEYILTEHKRDLENENVCREADKVMPAETTWENKEINTEKEVDIDTQGDEIAFENKRLEVVEEYSTEMTSIEISNESAKKNPFEIEGDISMDFEQYHSLPHDVDECSKVSTLEVQDLENEQNSLVEDMDDNKRKSSSKDDDPEELAILIAILKGNKDTEPHFLVTDSAHTEGVENKVVSQDEDPEELKLLIAMLNQNQKTPVNAPKVEFMQSSSECKTDIFRKSSESSATSLAILVQNIDDTKMEKDTPNKQTKSSNAKTLKTKDDTGPELKKTSSENEEEAKTDKSGEKQMENQNKLEANRHKLEAQKLKDEKYRQIKLANEEARRIEKKNKIEEKRIKDEKLKQLKLEDKEEQRILKEKWIEQEKSKNQVKYEQEKEGKTDEKRIPMVEPRANTPNNDLPNSQLHENVNPLLIDYAESVSSEIIKEAKESDMLTTGEVENHLVPTQEATEQPSEISSKNEDLRPELCSDDGEIQVNEPVPVVLHADVETILKIIKETDDEFKEKERDLLDLVERKRKEENIKQMEKELKKQKKIQDQLKKENEKAQRKREKLEKEDQKKRQKEEQQAQKKMETKLKKERETETRRIEQESKAQNKKKLPLDPEAKKQIEREKQLAVEREMSQYRITPEADEGLNLTSATLVCDTIPELDEAPEGEEVKKERKNPFQPEEVYNDDDDDNKRDEDMHQRIRKVNVDPLSPMSKDEPKHVKWTKQVLPSTTKDLIHAEIGTQPVLRTSAEQSNIRTQPRVSSQPPKIASPLPAKEVFLTQPEESESRATSVMATSAGGQRSPDDLDEFSQFATGHPHQNGQNGGGVSPDGIEPDYGYEEDELDFTPQNGYIADEQDFVPYHEEEPLPTKDTKAPKERKSREPIKMPSVDIKGKLDAMKGMKMPSASDVAESLNPMNSLKRPLGVRVREEDPNVQRERALIVKNNTVAELGNLKHPLDIPMPKFRSRNKSSEAAAKKAAKSEEVEKESVKEDTSTPGKGALFNTLPKSMRQQNLVTSQREIEDPKVLKERQELIKSHTPAELSQIRGISDFPVPSKITNMFEKKEKETKRAPSADQEQSSDQPKEEWSLYGTLPRSMRETKLVTNTREMLDPKELEQRQTLVHSKSPTELSQIHGIDDIPVPTKIQNIFKTRSRSGSLSKLKRTRSESLNRSSGNMTFTLPKAWKETKLITQVKVEEDEAVLAQRRNLTETKTPNELSQITSIADLPIPSALENFLKSDKKPKEGTRDETSSPTRINLDNMYDNLPRSLKTELLVKTKVEENDEVLKKRQEMVATKKPAELSQIGGFSEIPVPTALENIFKTGPPKAPRRKSKEDIDGKRKRNFTTGGILSYENLPDGLKTELLVKTKVVDDPELLEARREMTRTKTPNELGQIHGISDFPLPEKLDTLMRPSKRNLKSTKDKQLEKKRSKSWSSLPGRISTASIPSALRTELMVKSKFEDPDVQKMRQEMVNTKSVSELGQIHGLSDFPIPTTLERLVDKNARKSNVDTKSEDTRPMKDKLYDTLPKSMKTELLVKVRDENPEVQKQRQELVRSKSPIELSQISSISDFPVPATIEKMYQKPSEDSDSAPVPPPRRARLENLTKENLYESMPSSLKTELMVKTKVIEDEEVLKQRRELIRSKSPAELSEIHGLGEFPVPTFVEQSMDSLKRIRSKSGERKDQEEGGLKGMYDKVPESLKTQLLVKSKIEDPEIQKERAEAVKTKSVNELSQISTLSDFPVPEAIEILVSRRSGAVERKKRFREKQRSLSARNLNEMVPQSLKTQLLVKSKAEKPEVQRERAQIVSSKSVSELSQVTSLSDIPIPTTLERLLSKSRSDLTDGASSGRTSRFDMSNLNTANIYATLPKSMKSQLMVKSKIEDPEVQKSHKEITESKTVAELSQIHSMAEFPVPATIEKIIERGRQSSQGSRDQTDRSGLSSPAQWEGNIYASLPRSLKSELAVKSKIQDPELVQERKEFIANKSVNELSQITSLSDVPIPTPIQKMIDTAQNLKVPKTEGEEQNKSRPGSRGPSYDIYASLPRSLKSELRVRTKVEEDEEELKRRQNLVETKTPAELSQIHNLSEVPLPRRVEAWLHHSEQQSSSSLGRSKKEIKEIVYKSMLPDSMTKPCVVRSRIEDPEVLVKRQELQQEKSIHELSKIRNLNEFPLPRNIKLPDIPLPSVKNILKMVAPTAKNGNAKNGKQNKEAYGEYTPASTPANDLLTDDEMLRYDTSTPGGDTTHRDQDFGYEIIDQSSSPMVSGAPQHIHQIPAQFHDDIVDQTCPQIAVTQEEDSLAEQYRGTPPLKSKKKKPDRRSQSHEISDQVQLGDEIPPPLPPKRPSSVRRELRESHSNSPLATGGQVSKSTSASRVPGSYVAQDEFLSCADDPNPVQARPLPPAPSSVRSSIHHSGSGHSFASARSGISNNPDQFHSVASTLHSGTLVDSNNMRRSGDDDENTLADSILDSMHSCADTMVTTGDGDDATLHSCADTLNESDDERDFGDSPTPPISSG